MICKDIWNYCLAIVIAFGALVWNGYNVYASEDDCTLPLDHWAVTCSLPEWYDWDSGGMQCVINECGATECFRGGDPVIIHEGTDSNFDWWKDVIE